MLLEEHPWESALTTLEPASAALIVNPIIRLKLPLIASYGGQVEGTKFEWIYQVKSFLDSTEPASILMLSFIV
jgi:hypothetical protein